MVYGLVCLHTISRFESRSRDILESTYSKVVPDNVNKKSRWSIT